MDSTGGTSSIRFCGYCGNYHTYSEEMCRDMTKNIDGLKKDSWWGWQGVMHNDWTKTIAEKDAEIERLTDLLKKSEEEMLFWRREFRLLNAAEIKAEEEIAALKRRLAPIEAVYKKYNVPYEDNSEESKGDYRQSFFDPNEWEYELWQAIKEAEHE